MTDRFRYPKWLGNRGDVLIVDGDVHFEHPLLGRPVVVPIGQIAAAVRINEVDLDVPALAREARIPHLGGGTVLDANAAVLFRNPVPVTGLKAGTQRDLGVTSRERRAGVDIDGFRLTLECPDELVEALMLRRVPRHTSVNRALAQVIGHGSDADVAHQRVQRDRSRGRARRGVAMLGVVASVLLALKVAPGNTEPVSPASVGATVVWALVSGMATTCLLAFPGRQNADRARRQRPVRDQVGIVLVRSLAACVVPLGILLPPLLVARVLVDLFGLSHAIAFGLGAGVACGIGTGLGLRWLRAPSS